MCRMRGRVSRRKKSPLLRVNLQSGRRCRRCLPLCLRGWMALRGCRLVHRCSCRLFARHPLLRAFINVVTRIASCRRRMAVTLGFMSSRRRFRAVRVVGIGRWVVAVWLLPGCLVPWFPCGSISVDFQSGRWLLLGLRFGCYRTTCLCCSVTL